MHLTGRASGEAFPVLWRSEWSAVLLKLLRAPPQASIPTRQPHLDQ